MLSKKKTSLVTGGTRTQVLADRMTITANERKPLFHCFSNYTQKWFNELSAVRDSNKHQVKFKAIYKNSTGRRRLSSPCSCKQHDHCCKHSLNHCNTSLFNFIDTDAHTQSVSGHFITYFKSSFRQAVNINVNNLFYDGFQTIFSSPQHLILLAYYRLILQ